MHKGIIMLVKAENKNEALVKLGSFLEEYVDKVWDWYQIGGRWSQTLAPKYKEFTDKIESFNIKTNVDIQKLDKKLAEIWKNLGMTTNHPYSNHYNLPKNGTEYDVMPLSECIDTVKEWSFDLKEEGEKLLENCNKWKSNLGMYGYCLKKAGEVFSQNFCFDCNVFNTENYDYSIPEDLNGWFAIMLDIHN